MCNWGGFVFGSWLSYMLSVVNQADNGKFIRDRISKWERNGLKMKYSAFSLYTVKSCCETVMTTCTVRYMWCSHRCAAHSVHYLRCCINSETAAFIKLFYVPPTNISQPICLTSGCQSICSLLKYSTQPTIWQWAHIAKAISHKQIGPLTDSPFFRESRHSPSLRLVLVENSCLRWSGEIGNWALRKEKTIYVGTISRKQRKVGRMFQKHHLVSTLN